MITPNTRVTALDILEECGVEKAEEQFGKVRVRIAGLAGINRPDHPIKIPANVTHLEVIVGTKVYELELSQGNEKSNKDVFEVTPRAKAQAEAIGKEVSKQALHMTAVKKLAYKMIAADENGQTIELTEQEEAIKEEASKLKEVILHDRSTVQVAKPTPEKVKSN